MLLHGYLNGRVLGRDGGPGASLRGDGVCEAANAMHGGRIVLVLSYWR